MKLSALFISLRNYSFRLDSLRLDTEESEAIFDRQTSSLL